MSKPQTDQRDQGQNPSKRPDTTQIQGEIDLSIYDVDVSEPFGFGEGELGANPVIDPGGSDFKIGQNPIGEGAGSQRVADIQNMLISELDSNGMKTHPSEVLPNFGVDGVWRCETQEAFNRLIKEKGLQDSCNSGGKTVAMTDGVSQKSVSGCGGIVACQVTQEIMDALRQKAIGGSEVVEEPESAPAKRESIDDQCFLIKNLTEVVKSSVPSSQASFYANEDSDIQDRFNIKYKNIHKIHTQDPATIMNRLRLTKGLLELLNIRHWQLSELVPTIRVYKEYYEGPLKKPREVEMEFRTFVDPVKDLQAMMESQIQRGSGVGISNFTFVYKGVSPATQKADIEASLVIEAQNFNELFKVRQGLDQDGKPLEGGYRIIDLILMPRSQTTQTTNVDGITKTREYDPNFYQIKVKAGWASNGGGGILSDDLAAAVKDNQVEMFLAYIGHDFDFKDNGNVSMTVKFRARIEMLLLDKRSSILFDPEVQRVIDERAKKIADIREAKSKLSDENKKDCQDAGIKQLQDLYNRSVNKERERSYLSLLRDLTKEGCIYTAEIRPEDVGDAAEGVPAKFRVRNYSCEDDGGDPLDLTTKQPGLRRINYFFLGDMLALAVNNVVSRRPKESNNIRQINYGNMRFMLSPSPVEIQVNESKKNLNIADIPVSVELFSDFMNDRVIQARRNVYPLLSFVKDAINHIVYESLAPDCLGGDDRIDVNFTTGIISADAADGNQDIVDLKIKEDKQPYLDLDQYGKNLAIPPEDSQGIFGIPGALRKKKNPVETKFVFESFNKKSLSESYEYIVVYPYNVEPKRLSFDPNNSEFSSRYERDLSNGILHLTTGLDRGLVKSMSFSKTEIQWLKEARFKQFEANSDLQLSNVYNCDVEMYGNNLFFPGTKLFINPRGLGSDAIGDPGIKGTYANTMGLGGYHDVVNVTHTINRSGYSVNFKALFQTSGDGFGVFGKRANKIGDTIVLECSDIEKQIDKLASELGGAINRTEGS